MRQAKKAAEGAVSGQIVGPADERELLGCQDEPGAPVEYAVAGADFLNLRQGPSLDAPIAAVLPRGVGVSGVGTVQGEWRQVATGLLTGWVMARYLEPVWR